VLLSCGLQLQVVFDGSVSLGLVNNVVQMSARKFGTVDWLWKC